MAEGRVKWFDGKKGYGLRFNGQTDIVTFDMTTLDRSIYMQFYSLTVQNDIFENGDLSKVCLFCITNSSCISANLAKKITIFSLGCLTA